MISVFLDKQGLIRLLNGCELEYKHEKTFPDLVSFSGDLHSEEWSWKQHSLEKLSEKELHMLYVKYKLTLNLKK